MKQRKLTSFNLAHLQSVTRSHIIGYTLALIEPSGTSGAQQYERMSRKKEINYTKSTKTKIDILLVYNTFKISIIKLQI